jgi:putative peptidoglycan lipid II flippase
MIALPAAVALALLAVPLLATMFQYNAFKESDVIQASISLIAYSTGVLAFVMIKVLAPGFYAQQNTKTPVKIAAISVVCNIVLSLILIGPLKHAGLALAISLAAWINAGLLGFTLWNKNVYNPQKGWFMFLLRVVLAIVGMAAVIVFLRGHDDVWLNATLGVRVWQLLQVVAAGGLVYFLVLYILGLRPHQMLLKRNS